MSGFVKIHTFRKLIKKCLSTGEWGLVAGRCVGGAIDLGDSGETVRAKRPRLGVDWLAEGKM